MTYEHIVYLIKATCLKCDETGSILVGRRPDASLITVNGSAPLMFLYYPDFTAKGQANETVRISMLFLQQDDPNNNEGQRITIHNNMKVLSDLFLRTFVSSIQVAGSTAVYNADKRQMPEDRILAGTMSGFGISFTITIKTKQC